MAVIQAAIKVPDNMLPGVQRGDIHIMGLAKNAGNGQIIKHLETLKLDDKESAALAAELIGVGIVALAGIGVGIYTLANKSKVKHFKKALNAYIEAVNNQTLTIKIINDLINALDELKGRLRKHILIDFSSDELTALITCLCNHTQTLAEANNINLKFEPTEEEKADMLLMLRNNLIKQRDIFELAS